MGQGPSVAEDISVTPEQLSQELALKFANKSFTPLELLCFKDVFRSHADIEGDVKHWNEATLCRFLELPDVLGAGPVLFQLATFLAAFPFWELSPCFLTVGNLLKVVTIMTGREAKILEESRNDKIRMIYASMAVVDRRASESLRIEDFWTVERRTEEQTIEDALQGLSASKELKSKMKDESYTNDDKLALAALDLLKARMAYTPLIDRPEVSRSIIPSDNFLKLVELLLFIAPLGSQDDLATYFARLSDETLKQLRSSANAILASFGVEEMPGISYHAFQRLIPSSLPFIFDGLGPLFEHFLFQSPLDLAKRKRSASATSQVEESAMPAKSSTIEHKLLPSPLPQPGEILDLTILTQISFFIPSTTLFYRLHHLYSGSTHGFSLGSFETTVFTWRAPTLILVTGTLLPSTPSNSRERAFADALPPKRYPNSKARNNKVTYGAYVSTPWKQTHKSHFGDFSTLLFQLSPLHDVFRASEISKDYVAYTTPSSGTPHAGINFGSPLSASAGSKASGHGWTPHVNLGPISLYLEDSLEYGVFTHTAAGGGSFHPSVSPARTPQPCTDSISNMASPRSPTPHSPTVDFTSASTATAARRRSSVTSPTSPISPSTAQVNRRHINSTSTTSRPAVTTGNWQDRFEIDAIEVWGCGGNEEAEGQRRRIEGEEREARMRREGVVGRGFGGDLEAEREILRMAGLIGMNREGGSMQ